MILNPKKVELVQTAFLPEQLVSDHRPQIVFAGRSNVGKSSLLNRLFNRRNLARVSRQPGKTRSINFFLVNDQIFFVDLPGYGYSKAPQQEISRWRKLVEHYFENSPSLKALVHLIDIRHDPTALDIELYDWTAQVFSQRLFVLTKADKLTRGKTAQAVESLARQFRVPRESIVAFSAETGAGKKEIMGWIGGMVLDRS